MITAPKSRRLPLWIRSSPIVDDQGVLGRVLTAGYSVRHEFAPIPVFFLGRHLVETRIEYVRRLQEVGETGDWIPWVEYLLTAAERAAQLRTGQVGAVTASWDSYLRRMRTFDPSAYNHHLLVTLFGHLPLRFEISEFDLGTGQRTLELKTMKEEYPMDRMVQRRSR